MTNLSQLEARVNTLSGGDPDIFRILKLGILLCKQRIALAALDEAEHERKRRALRRARRAREGRLPSKGSATDSQSESETVSSGSAPTESSTSVASSRSYVGYERDDNRGMKRERVIEDDSEADDKERRKKIRLGEKWQESRMVEQGSRRLDMADKSDRWRRISRWILDTGRRRRGRRMIS